MFAVLCVKILDVFSQFFVCIFFTHEKMAFFGLNYGDLFQFYLAEKDENAPKKNFYSRKIALH